MVFSVLGYCNSSYASSDVEKKQKEIRAKINRVQWLENVETNKLYKNQQKLESATTNLQKSKTQVLTAEKELYGMQAELDKVSREYFSLNTLLTSHVRKVFKSQKIYDKQALRFVRRNCKKSIFKQHLRFCYQNRNL